MRTNTVSFKIISHNQRTGENKNCAGRLVCVKCVLQSFFSVRSGLQVNSVLYSGSLCVCVAVFVGGLEVI